MDDDIRYSNSRLARYIDEYVHSETDRIILRRKLIDGWSYSEIAAVVQLDKTTCWHRVEKFLARHYKHFCE